MATASSSKFSSGASRVLNKLKVCVESGKYYEAHQMYRTLYFRYSSQKRFTDLQELLYDGALELLHHKQNSSGADLATLWVDVLVKGDATTDDLNLERVARLHSLILPDAPERVTFLTAALKWSRTPECRWGHPKLHQLIALTLWKEKNYQQSWQHFLRSMDGDSCASMLVEYHTSFGYASEVDLFIAQAVLQFLCLQKKLTATVVFFRYTERHPCINKGPPFLLPLLNFLRFLLVAVESGKLGVFTVLCEQYQPALQRDPAYSEYLDKIGQLFFGLPPPKPKKQNMFGNFLQSIFSGLDDNGEDGATPGTSHELKLEDLD